MTFDLAQMIADREAGTPADKWIPMPTPPQNPVGVNADTRRENRVPAMEAEIIRLTARVAELEGEVATVNPLVWKPSGFEGNRKAGGLGLGYFIECAARQFSCSVSDGSGSLFKVLYRGASEEAAKAAAQADYDARIRAALSTHTDEPKT